MAKAPFLVRIWGARGSLPAPAAANCEFGSDTCMRRDALRRSRAPLRRRLGRRQLSANRLDEDDVRDFDLFLSHCHFDHIMGLPFLKPLYESDTSWRESMPGISRTGRPAGEMVERFMAPPFFPVTPQAVPRQGRVSRLPAAGDVAAASRHRDRDGAPQPPERLRRLSREFRRPLGLLHHRSRAYSRPQRIERLEATIRGADILIYDCMYTDAEFEPCRGYGHSTWEEGVRLCEAAGVKHLVIFHHRPGRDDEGLRRIEAEAKARFPGGDRGENRS